MRAAMIYGFTEAKRSRIIVVQRERSETKGLVELPGREIRDREHGSGCDTRFADSPSDTSDCRRRAARRSRRRTARPIVAGNRTVRRTDQRGRATIVEIGVHRKRPVVVNRRSA